MGLAGQVIRLDRDRAAGPGGAVGPNPVNLVLDSAQGDVATRQGLFKRLKLFDRVKPGIKANLAALRKMLLKPVAKAHIGPVNGCEMPDIDLRLDLHAIAAVDKHPGHIRQHCTEPRRAGKPGKPGQTVIAGGDIFTLMGIGARHKKTTQTDLCRGGTQRGKARRALTAAGSVVKGLKHHIARLMPMTRARARGSLSNSAASCSVIAPAS